MNAPTLLDKWRVMERAFVDPELTDRDRKVLFFVLGRLDNSMGYADLSLPWIAQRAGIGNDKGNASRILAKLQRCGYLACRKGVGRAARNRYSIASIELSDGGVACSKKVVTGDNQYADRVVTHDNGKVVTQDNEKVVASDNPNIVLESLLKNPSKQNHQSRSTAIAADGSAGSMAGRPKLQLVRNDHTQKAARARTMEVATERVLVQLMRDHGLDRSGAYLMLLEMPSGEQERLLGPDYCKAAGW